MIRDWFGNDSRAARRGLIKGKLALRTLKKTLINRKRGLASLEENAPVNTQMHVLSRIRVAVLSAYS